MSWFQNETVDLNALFVKTILFALAGATMAWTMYSYSLCFEKKYGNIFTSTCYFILHLRLIVNFMTVKIEPNKKNTQDIWKRER